MKRILNIQNRISEVFGSVHSVYQAIRALDDQGSGNLRLNIGTLAAMLGKSKVTIKRLLKRGFALGFYYDLYFSRGEFRCAYKSQQRLLAEHEQCQGGLKTQVPTEHFLTNPKLAITWAEACERTYRHYRKLRRLPSRKASDEMFGRKVITYDDCLALDCDGVRRNRRSITITHPHLIHAGASQETIAEGLGRHRVTANRRLKKAVRLFNVRPHMRVIRWTPMEDLPSGVLENLLEYNRYGRYTLGRNGMVWENSTCIYPMDTWNTPEQAIEMLHSTGELSDRDFAALLEELGDDYPDLSQPQVNPSSSQPPA